MPHLHHSFKAPVLAGLVAVFAVSAPASSASAPAPSAKPNILFILADNLGYGEIGAYGGGETRGAATPRLDRLANEGLRLTNMNMETQCTPKPLQPHDGPLRDPLGHLRGALRRGARGPDAMGSDDRGVAVGGGVRHGAPRQVASRQP